MCCFIFSFWMILALVYFVYHLELATLHSLTQISENFILRAENRLWMAPESQYLFHWGNWGLHLCFTDLLSVDKFQSESWLSHDFLPHIFFSCSCRRNGIFWVGEADDRKAKGRLDCFGLAAQIPSIQNPALFSERQTNKYITELEPFLSVYQLTKPICWPKNICRACFQFHNTQVLAKRYCYLLCFVLVCNFFLIKQFHQFSWPPPPQF